MSSLFSPSVTLTVRRPIAPTAQERRSGLCVVGIDPRSAVSAAGLAPLRVIGDESEGAVMLRVSPGAPLSILPGLEHDSRVRDAVALALGAGAPSVDVLLVRLPGRSPKTWEQRSLSLGEPLLDEQSPGLLVFPDLSPSVRMEPVLAALQPELVARQQLLLLDLPQEHDESKATLERLLDRQLSLDVVLMAWCGPELARQQHQWRSAAALLGGALVARDPSLSAVGTPIRIANGRPPLCPQAENLRRSLAEQPRLAGGQHVAYMAVTGDGRHARLLSEPTLRRPLATWPLAALRSAKLVLSQLTYTARGFLFHAARTSEASALAAALQASVSDWIARGLLVGDNGARPRFNGSVSADPARPGIQANMRAWLQPWTQRMDIQVSLTPGAPAAVVELE